MRLSEQWLREWANPPLALAALAEQLTMAGLEVEAIEAVAGAFSGVIVGEVLEVTAHPDAQKLHVCIVSVGVANNLQIVCAAANVTVGLKVAVATLGAALPNGMVIKETKLRGVLSQGMLCSASELGLAETSTGILELVHEAFVGKDFREWLELDDKTIELSITPNRGDCLSVAGIAREIAALNQLDFSFPQLAGNEIAASTATLPVTILAPQDCPRYIGRIIKNINPNAQSPLWLQERLRRSGTKCISAIVDVTNYVLLELGQPLHAFDLAKINKEIIIRKAELNEKLTLLNNQTVELTIDTLLIADAIKPLAIAGVMGGLDSAVTNSTTAIFLESAFFNPSIIMGKMRQYGCNTDSAYRFERGVDPDLQQYAIERATALIVAIVGGEAGSLITVKYPEYITKPAAINLRSDRITTILGFKIADTIVEEILVGLGMQLTQVNTGWEVTVPPHRFDISGEIDLIEELIRIKGYEHIPLHHPLIENHLKPCSEQQLDIKRLRSVLVDRGYHEAITYSFIDPQLQQHFFPALNGLTLINPMSSEMSVMRMSLWPGLITALQHNVSRQQARIRLFETGLCFIPTENSLAQDMYVAGIATGTLYSEQWDVPSKPVDFFDVKADIETFFQLNHRAANVKFITASHPSLHPGQSAVIKLDNITIGYMGKIHPELGQKLQLDNNIYLFELNLALLSQAKMPQYKPLSKFPSIRRDLALVVAQQVTVQAIYDCIEKAAGDWLQQIQLFDIYQAQEIKAGYKSVAIGIILQHSSRTLVEQEVNELISLLIGKLHDTLGAVLRE